jgi:hypothetical protein
MSVASARKLLVLFIFSAMLLSVTCRKVSEPANQVSIQLEGNQQTFRIGRETIAFTLKDALGKPSTGARVSLEANMSHAGMAPVFADATEVGPGSYRGVVEFSMAGDWIITIHARLADGQKVERQFEVKGVRSD